VISIETTAVDSWLFGTPDQVAELLRPPAMVLIDARPMLGSPEIRTPPAKAPA